MTNLYWDLGTLNTNRGRKGSESDRWTLDLLQAIMYSKSEVPKNKWIAVHVCDINVVLENQYHPLTQRWRCTKDEEKIESNSNAWNKSGELKTKTVVQYSYHLSGMLRLPTTKRKDYIDKKNVIFLAFGSFTFIADSIKWTEMKCHRSLIHPHQPRIILSVHCFNGFRLQSVSEISVFWNVSHFLLIWLC